VESLSTLTQTPIALSENARRVLEKRYLVKGEDGTVVETPEALFLRVAKTVAGAEKAFALRKITPRAIRSTRICEFFIYVLLP